MHLHPRMRLRTQSSRAVTLRFPNPLIAALATALVAACSGDPAQPGGDDVAVIDTSDANEDPSIDVPDPPDADVAEEVDADASEDPAEDPQQDGDDVAPDVVEDVGPPPSCDTAAECDDGLACTVDTCPSELGHCVWEVAPNQCLVGRQCFDSGARPPRNPCAVCDPSADPLAFTPISEGEACDDGDICTADTVCTEGACVGEALQCEDRNSCTVNLCDPVLGCVFEPVANGVACDDASACTTDDVCNEGTCVGAPVRCTDDNPCTDNSCDPALGCVTTFNTAPCEDGDLCTDGDTCSEGVCVAGGPTNCEDGNECTIDICDARAGCSYLPSLNACCTGTVSICDDGDPCTTDICNPADGTCRREPNTARCNDGSVCTSNDTCREGACRGTPVSCDDRNPCTADYCSPTGGCGAEVVADGTSCDDGIACTFGEACRAGACVPARSECVCTPVFGRQAVKLTSLRIGTDGRPGNALDLDRNPATCAPSGNCSDGRHNALAAIAGFANESLADGVADGSLMILVEINDMALNPFEMALHQGDLATSNPTCSFQTAVCDYVVSQSGFHPDSCARTVSLPATRSGSNITAGGPGTLFPFNIPLGDSTLTITLYDVRFEGTITTSGDAITSLNGIIGGAVPRAQLIAALESLDPASLPLDPAAIINLLNILVRDDIDTNGDGRPDAASIGIPITGIGARLVGVD